MIQPKEHLRNIYRSVPEEFDRTAYLRLDKNEDVDGFSSEFIQGLLSGITPGLISSYPQLFPLYEKLSGYLGVNRDQLLITAGSDAAIKNIFEVFITPGDKILTPDPTYAMYYVYSQLFQAELIKIQFDGDLNLPIDKFLENISAEIKMVVLANPNSPTGTIVTKDDVLKILKKAEENNVLVLVDEAYYPYHPFTILEMVDKFDNLIITRTFSKAYGLASLRVGYAISNPDIIKAMITFRPIYETTGISAHLACKMLDNNEIVQKKIDETIKGKEYVISEIAKLGLKVYASHTNFIHIRVGEENVQKVCNHLEKSRILVRTGFEHETLKHCIRITTGSVNTMEPFVESMKLYYGNEN